MESIKSFDQELCDENNHLAIIMSMNYLISTGHYYYKEHPLEQIESFKNQDFKLYLKKSDKEVRVEVERKKTWIERDKWQGYKTLDIPHRKSESKSDLFIMTNNDCNILAIIKTKDVLKSEVYKKDTKYTKQEEFYAVKLNNIKFIKLQWSIL